MKYLCLRNCFINGQIYLKGEEHELPDSMKDSTKFQVLGEPVEVEPEPQEDSLVCSTCGKECKSKSGLISHVRVHETKES